MAESERGYLVTCEVEVFVNAKDEDAAAQEAVKVLDGEHDIISGMVLDVNPSGDIDSRLRDITVRV